MSKYIVKTDIFRYFGRGDIIIPYNQGAQYGKEDSLPGGNIIPAEFIDKLPEYFEKIEMEWEVEDIFIGKAVSNKESHQKIISFIGELSDRQAEAIETALNELD